MRTQKTALTRLTISKMRVKTQGYWASEVEVQFLTIGPEGPIRKL
jgi:hypothetical protein